MALTPQTLELLKADLGREEGHVLHVYPDHLGKLTCGIGHLIVRGDAEYGKPKDTPITEARCDELFRKDVDRTVTGLFAAIPWMADQPQDVQRALVNMAFQLGVAGVTAFKNTLMYIRRREYDVAYTNGLKSLWARQTPARANRVLTLIKNAR